jgi:hypothetical protein
MDQDGRITSTSSMLIQNDRTDIKQVCTLTTIGKYLLEATEEGFDIVVEVTTMDLEKQKTDKDYQPFIWAIVYHFRYYSPISKN